MVSHLTRIECYCSIRLDHHYGHGQSLNTDRVLVTDHHYGDGQSLNTDRVLLFYQTGPSLYGQSLNTDRVLLFYQTDHHYGYGQSLNTIVMVTTVSLIEQ